MIRTALAAFSLLVASLLAAPASAAGEIGGRCGGVGHIPCESGLWCDPPSGLCGKAEAVGRCVDIKGRCFRYYHPVCGCNGVDYDNECARQHEFMPQAHIGKC